jgi:hypothetical protein
MFLATERGMAVSERWGLTGGLLSRVDLGGQDSGSCN